MPQCEMCWEVLPDPSTALFTPCLWWENLQIYATAWNIIEYITIDSLCKEKYTLKYVFLRDLLV